MKTWRENAAPLNAEARGSSSSSTPESRHGQALSIGLLTGGDDRPYAFGLALALAAEGVSVDFIGSDDLDDPELRCNESIRFLNLRGDQREDAPFRRKLLRLLKYYSRLMLYAARARPPIFHVLWNNKFELFDRTLLMLYYRLCGHKVVLTAHNVNAARRDSRDNVLNRFTLRIQYHLAAHIFVHTSRMKDELIADFGVRDSRVSVIPFGINDTSPRTDLTCAQARQRLGLEEDELAMLFFGQIAPYKGLEYLVAALPEIASRVPRARLIIAGKIKKGGEQYWRGIERALMTQEGERTIRRIEHIPDEDVETFFKAADVLVAPYVNIFQSGVPFLAYSFGLPVIVTDVGSLKDEVVEGETGFVCAPRDPQELAGAVERYSRSELYRNLQGRRTQITEMARERHSWAKVARITRSVYEALLGRS